jgi:hypothetical protein
MKEVLSQVYEQVDLARSSSDYSRYHAILEASLSKVSHKAACSASPEQYLVAEGRLRALDTHGMEIWQSRIISKKKSSIAVHDLILNTDSVFGSEIGSTIGLLVSDWVQELTVLPTMQWAKGGLPNEAIVLASAKPSGNFPAEDERLSLNDPRGVQVLGKAPSAYVAEQFGKSWAVVIGINDYEKAPRLKYAVADAKAMAGVLRQQGFQVTELYNRQATRGAVERELSDKLVERVGEQDRVVIFYAGHGETKTARGGRTMGYLLPVEGQQDSLGETAVSMGRIKELADALPSKQVLFLVDVCYGGIAGQQFRSTLPPMTVAYLKQITRERGRQLITAGGPEQQAMESPEWGHSVFTYYLLEGLSKGLADLNDDGIIPASELYSYLDSRVFSAAQMKGHTQRPELWSLAAEKGEFVFIPSKQQSPSVLTSPR